MVDSSWVEWMHVEAGRACWSWWVVVLEDDGLMVVMLVVLVVVYLIYQLSKGP